MTQNSKTPIIITSIICVSIILLALIFLNALSPSSGKTISTRGEASLDIIPEITSVYINIESSATSSKEARDENSQILSQVKSSLLSQGFEESDLQTQNFNIYEDIDWRTGKSKGYKATHSLIVKFPSQNSEKIGQTVDAAIDGGAKISYINFELTPKTQSEIKAQALELAAADARTKAQALASGLDKNLGSLVSASDTFTYSPWLAFDSKDAAVSASSEEIRQAATQINPSERTISASVTTVYKIY